MNPKPPDPSNQPDFAPGPLDLDRLAARLQGARVGHTIHYHATLPSTMPLALELARRPETRSGTLVLAEEQTRGRGRRQRTWHAPPHCALLVSIILKPPHYMLAAAQAPMLAGVALQQAAAAFLPQIAGQFSLKWPNDLIIGADPACAAKAAGLLAESGYRADGSLAYVALGIGVNVNQRRADLPEVSPPHMPPTSLYLACREAAEKMPNAPSGQAGPVAGDGSGPLDRSALLILLCERLSATLNIATAAELRTAWKRCLSTLGQDVAIYTQDPAGALSAASGQPSLLGRAVDVNHEGALIVETGDGVRHTLHAADVSLRYPGHS